MMSRYSCRRDANSSKPCMVDNLKARFINDKFLDAGACLNPSSWPDDENQRALFGDQQVVNLAKLCHVNAIETLTEFREYQCPLFSYNFLAIIARMTMACVEDNVCFTLADWVLY
jgi:hypothetical protein